MRYTYEQPEYLDKVGVVHLVQQLKVYIDGIATGDIDLSDYVTKAELQAELDALDINIDLSAYATKEELTDALSNIDLSSYATKEYVTDAINNAQLGGDGSSVDLSIYAKKSDLDAKADTTHTHTMSDITDYSAPDLSSYAKKTDIPSLNGYALKSEIPSIDGFATTEYVDNAVANIPSSGTVDLSNYYTKADVYTKEETYTQDEVDGLIENNIHGKSAYEVYLDSRTYRSLNINTDDDKIYAEDGLFKKEYYTDDVVGETYRWVTADDYVRCNYSSLSSMLNDLVNSGYSETTVVYYQRVDGKNLSFSLVKDAVHTYPTTQAPYVDLVYCGNTATTTLPAYKKGDYFYRFIRVSLYDAEIMANYNQWIPYLAVVTDENSTISYTRADENVYVKNGKGNIVITKPYTALKTVLSGNSKQVKLPANVYLQSSYSEYQTALWQIYRNMLFFLKNQYITQEEWLLTLKGEDGTVSFDSLTDEQKASLKGDKGDKGDTGEKGADGSNGNDGYTPVRGTDYWTQEDIDTIKAYIDTELGVIENGSY